jgi:hypothetical protein
VTDPSYPNAPAVRARPTVVTASSYLLYAAAGLTLLNAILSLSFIGTTTHVYREVYAGSDLEGTEGLVVGITAGGAMLNILFAAGLAVLAVFNNRGKNPSRIVTWVLGGLAVCCGGLGLAANGLTGSMNLESSSSGNVPPAGELEDRLSEALPGWYTPVTTTLSVLMVLAILGAVILLVLPAANEYFRKPQAGGWEPPTPGHSPYPNPPYPGQQPPGQQSPGQQPPGGEPPYPPPPGSNPPPPSS